MQRLTRKGRAGAPVPKEPDRSTDLRNGQRRQRQERRQRRRTDRLQRYFDVPELELPLWLGEVLAPLPAGLELDGLVVCELVLPLPEVLELDGVWELVLPLAPPEVPCEAK